MDAFKFFHICNHLFAVTDQDGAPQTLTITNGGTFVDLLINNAMVLDILEVKVLEYDPVTTVATYDDPALNPDYEGAGTQATTYDLDPALLVNYADYFTVVDGELVPTALPTTFYRRYLHNRIQWTVKPPKKYTVTARVLYTQQQVKQLAISECTRCQGNGWFVDVLDQTGSFASPSGIEKVAQRVVKDLMTKLGSSKLDLTYGTIMSKQLSAYSNTASDDKLFDDVRLIVSEVEDNYLARQALAINQLADSEILLKLTVVNVARATQDQRRILLELSITTREATQTLRIPL